MVRLVEAMLISAYAAGPRFLLIVCTVILYAGWPKFLFDSPAIFITDYTQRIICLIVFVVFSTRTGLATYPAQPFKATLILVAIVAGSLVISWGEFFIEVVYGSLLFANGFPLITSLPFLYFDLTFGLALVALSEELVFRQLFKEVWSARGYSIGSLYVISSLAFGMMHLPQGLLSVVGATLVGLLFMAALRATGSIWVPIVAHYIVNLVIFSEMGCLLYLRTCTGN